VKQTGNLPGGMLLVCNKHTITAMEKRLLGIILSILGVAGLLYAGISFMNGSGGTRNIKSIVVFGILGAVFFTAGIGLIRTTHDKET
jgi:uncharacterized membrane protein